MAKFTNKILGAFKNDDYEDDFDDEYYDDDYPEDDHYYEKRSGKSSGLFNKFKSGISRGGGYDDPDGDYDDPDDYDDDRRDDRNNYSFNKAAQKPQAPQRKGNYNEVCVIKPSSIDDSREITETLLNGKACIINFEGLHVEISQRIIDFISGSCYALDGNLQKISNYIFIATPNSVDISGDFQDILGAAATKDNSFDIAGFRSPLL